MNRRAFTLIELLLAAALSSILMAGLIVVLSGVSRDAQRVRLDRDQVRTQPLTQLLRRDLANARTVLPLPRGEGFILAGNAALDPKTGLPNGRLAQVTYRVSASRTTACLLREQTYLDDPLHPAPWAELVSVGVTRVAFSLPDRPAPTDQPGDQPGDESAEAISDRGFPIPAHPMIQLEYSERSIALAIPLR